MDIKRIEPIEPEFALHVTRQEMEAIKVGLGRLTPNDDQAIWGADRKKGRSYYLWLQAREALGWD